MRFNLEFASLIPTLASGTYSTMNIEQARINMIKQQIRACDVLDDSLLEILQNTPREAYVPSEYANLAFADTNIPLGHEEIMMTPCQEAQMLKALNVKKSDHVLEIGTGSGFVTALLAQLAKQVFTVDIIPEFTAAAKNKHQQFGYTNIEYFTDNAANGWDKKALYDVIAITGALPSLPDSFKQSLAHGGRLFAILGKSPAMQATLITRLSKDIFSTRVLFETVIKSLRYSESEVFQF